MSQNTRLLAYLKTHKRGITSGEAHIKLGIMRLSERVRELEGRWYTQWHPTTHAALPTYRIVRTRERHTDRFGSVSTVTRYRLA